MRLISSYIASDSQVLNPEHYDIADDMEHLRELLDGMDDPRFIG